jgi:hypothetical protein
MIPLLLRILAAHRWDDHGAAGVAVSKRRVARVVMGN